MTQKLSYDQDLIDAISVPLFFLDLNGEFIASNKAFTRFIGKADSEVKAAGVYSLLSPGNGVDHKNLDRLLLETGTVEPFEDGVIGAGGRHHSVIYRKSLAHDATGNHTGIITTIIDLTDLKGIERALIASESQKKAILDGFPGIIVLFDVRLSAIWVNDTVWQNMEMPIGKSCHDIVCKTKSECANCPIPHCVNDGQVRFVTHRVENNESGEDSFYEVIGTPVKDEEGSVESVIVIARNVTDRFELERQLRHSQKMEAIGTLAGGIAHDFNNVLTPIMGYTEIIKLKMRQEGLEDESISEYLGEILKAGKRAKGLVDQILAFSRSNEQKDSLQHLHPIVKEVVKLMRVTLPSTIKIEQDIDQECGTVTIDPVQIHQVLINLCTNSADAIGHNHGTLTIRLKKDHSVSVGRNGRVQIIVEDSGCGMDRSLCERIFEPYFSTKEKGHGTGMGLALVHSIVSRYGGKVEVESEVGEGTSFIISLPITADSSTEKIFEASKELVVGDGHVLLVDDEPQVLQVTRELLESLGYRVTGKNSSLEALKAFSESPDTFDVLLTDLTMPNLTGLELCTKVKKIRSNIPTILFTGYSEKVRGATEAIPGVDDICNKPVSLPELSQIVGRLLGRPLN